MNNKNNKNTFNNLSICSYNLLWQIMDYQNSNRFHNINKKLLSDYKNNILFNIQKVIDYYNPTIYCFQEASNYKHVLTLFNHNYSFKINKSDKEYMITIWQHNKLNLINSFKGEFEKGRPFNILIFFNKMDNYKFILINIHTGHEKDTQNSVINPIQKVLDKIRLDDTNLLIDIHRVIITGDFNRDINDEIRNNNYYVLINKKKYYFNYLKNKNNSNTCCDIYGKKFNKNCDTIIDTFYKPILVHPLNIEEWYKFPSSDHVMILAIVK